MESSQNKNAEVLMPPNSRWKKKEKKSTDAQIFEDAKQHTRKLHIHFNKHTLAHKQNKAARGHRGHYYTDVSRHLKHLY